MVRQSSAIPLQRLQIAVPVPCLICPDQFMRPETVEWLVRACWIKAIKWRHSYFCPFLSVFAGMCRYLPVCLCPSYMRCEDVKLRWRIVVISLSHYFQDLKEKKESNNQDVCNVYITPWKTDGVYRLLYFTAGLKKRKKSYKNWQITLYALNFLWKTKTYFSRYRLENAKQCYSL